MTLGGQSLDQDAQWIGRPVKEVVPRAHGEYLVTLPAYSAALLSVPNAHGALR